MNASGFNHYRSKKLNSMSLKRYLQTMERHIVKAVGDNPEKEIEIVDQYIKHVEEQKSLFLERCMPDIEFAELTVYEQNQIRKKEREEAVKKELEAIKA